MPDHTNVLRLAALGYRLIPWKPRKHKDDKTFPLISWKETRLTEAEIQAWLKVQPDADWSIIPEDTIVLDIENKKGLDGKADYSALAKENGSSWEAAIEGCGITSTKSGGLHLWYRQPGGVGITGGFHILPGVEVKSRNGGVHIPPSLGYGQVVPIGAARDFPCLPEYVTRVCRTRKTSKQATYKATRYGDGERRLMMCGMAGKLRSAGLSGPELYASLLAIRDSRCDNPETFTDDEVRGISIDYGTRAVGGTITAEAGCWIFQLLAGRDAYLSNSTIPDVTRLACDDLHQVSTVY